MLRRLPRFQGTTLSLSRARIHPRSRVYLSPSRSSQLLFSTLSNSKDDKEENAAAPARSGEIKRLLSLYKPEKKPLAISISALGVSTFTPCVYPTEWAK
ncbi:hypothetical protein GQ600_6593 [Phytophthora cactorum]|nr:hypothetical protein GQ600_6593 [Phytophthora cactorum]